MKYTHSGIYMAHLQLHTGQTLRLTDRQTDRQAGRQAGRQTDRQTDSDDNSHHQCWCL